jgi:hypothetical protein
MTAPITLALSGTGAAMLLETVRSDDDRMFHDEQPRCNATESARNPAEINGPLVEGRVDPRQH